MEKWKKELSDETMNLIGVFEGKVEVAEKLNEDQSASRTDLKNTVDEWSAWDGDSREFQVDSYHSSRTTTALYDLKFYSTKDYSC